MVTRDFAGRNGLQVNSKVPLHTLEGDKQFTIRGVMSSGGMSSAFGGNLAIMDIYAAQQMFGRGRRYVLNDAGKPLVSTISASMRRSSPITTPAPSAWKRMCTLWLARS